MVITLEKEFLYVGHYYDTENNYILKIGTTNDLIRRTKEHTRNYRRAVNYTLPKENEFIMDWFIKLSRYNTHRFEDSNRAKLIEEKIGNFIRNDRFVCAVKPPSIEIKIRKTYAVSL